MRILPDPDPHVGTSAENDDSGREKTTSVNVTQMSFQAALDKKY